MDLVSPCLIIRMMAPLVLILLVEKQAAVIMPMWAMEEYAMIRFMSFCRSLFILASHMLIILTVIIRGDKNFLIWGSMGMVNRMNP